MFSMGGGAPIFKDTELDFQHKTPFRKDLGGGVKNKGGSTRNGAIPTPLVIIKHAMRVVDHC